MEMRRRCIAVYAVFVFRVVKMKRNTAAGTRSSGAATKEGLKRQSNAEALRTQRTAEKKKETDDPRRDARDTFVANLHEEQQEVDG